MAIPFIELQLPHWNLLASTALSSEVQVLDSKLESLECESMNRLFHSSNYLMLSQCWWFFCFLLLLFEFCELQGLILKERMRSFIHNQECLYFFLAFPNNIFTGKVCIYMELDIFKDFLKQMFVLITVLYG